MIGKQGAADLFQRRDRVGADLRRPAHRVLGYGDLAADEEHGLIDHRRYRLARAREHRGVPGMAVQHGADLAECPVASKVQELLRRRRTGPGHLLTVGREQHQVGDGHLVVRHGGGRDDDVPVVEPGRDIAAGSRGQADLDHPPGGGEDGGIGRLVGRPHWLSASRFASSAAGTRSPGPSARCRSSSPASLMRNRVCRAARGPWSRW